MPLEISSPSLTDPTRWGLPPSVVPELATRLSAVWQRFRSCFRTRTRDRSELAYHYVRGLLTLETKRNFANIARRVISVRADGQDLQQFMSDSPWSAQAVFDQIQAELVERPEWQGGILTLDESGDERSGPQSAGAARQYFGRAGRVALGQVGVVLGYYHQALWALLDAQLYLPQAWFAAPQTPLRQRLHVPTTRTFADKPALGLQMIRRAKANGVPFTVVACDSLYGRNHDFRATLEQEQVLYVADTLAHFKVYPQPPQVGVPPTPPRKKGKAFSRWRVLNGVTAVPIEQFWTDVTLQWETVAIRHTERGLLHYRCAARRIWTINAHGHVREEWLLLREEHDGSHSFALSNASAETPVAQLAQWKSLRYFAERTIQDAKSEAGWDELIARKYRAWEHHTALDALALWFVATTKWEWLAQYPRDPALQSELELAQLPALSMANVRELLRAVLPLDQLSPEDALQLVTQHLVQRALSTRSRVRAQTRKNAPP
jgi:SRSO17 transposase